MNPPTELVLYNRLHHGSRSNPLPWVLVSMFVLVLALFLLVAAVGSGGEPMTAGRLLAALWAAVEKRPFDAVMAVLTLAVLLLQIPYTVFARRNERLILSAHSIAYRSPLPASLQFLLPGWSLSWGQVRRIELQRRFGATNPELTALVLHTLNGRRHVLPYLWVDSPEAARAATPSLRPAFRRRDPDAAHARLMDTPIMRFLGTLPNPKLPGKDAAAGGGFALERNRWSLAFVIAFFALVAYAFIDGLLYTETYAGDPPYHLMIGAGLAATLLGALLLRRAEVPWPEAAIVALLTGAALGGALYSGMLRFNQLTDTGGLRRHEYRLGADLSLTPEESDLPTLHFTRYADYWSSFANGSTHSFWLRRGGLGFYQVDLGPLRAAMREHFRRVNP
ncbi:MAG TPA: hypothetical protein VGA00_11115 [Acidiferrobacterales bacterium]